ncbi:hypothetical protein JZ751_025603 [Albula glossodonta]|uniref:Uncharacterized protein n=1 Tax=Albula glossodonta TaxID=121402 RepID=A0A8T2NQB1_9TELE|nr:hypothetical protein JZ751_025603 [Albula glossodonta]
MGIESGENKGAAAPPVSTSAASVSCPSGRVERGERMQGPSGGARESICALVFAKCCAPLPVPYCTSFSNFLQVIKYVVSELIHQPIASTCQLDPLPRS